MTPQVSPWVHAREMDEEVVLLDERTGKFLGLNSSAAIIWRTLVNGGTPEEAATGLTEAYEITSESALVETGKFVRSMIAEGVFAPDSLIDE